MTSSLYLTTEELNILSGVATPLLPTSVDTLFPIGFLTDGNQATPFRFASAASSLSILADLNRVLNPGFETWTGAIASDWTDDSDGSGAVTEENTIVNSGSNSAKLVGGGSGNEARIRTAIKVQAGWSCTIEAALRGDATNPIRVYIQNRQTGAYVAANGVWGSSKVHVLERTNSSFQVSSENITVEDASVAKRPVYDLHIWAEVATGTGYVDDMFMWPHWDFAALLGHNLGSNVVAKIQSDAVSAMSSPTDQVTFTLRLPSMYKLPAAIVTERFARVLLAGTNHAAPEIGEWILGQRKILPRGISLPYDIRPNVEIVGRGRAKPQSKSDDASMTFPVRLELEGENELEIAMISIAGGGRYGGVRTILVPQDDAPELYHGSLFIENIQRLAPGNVYDIEGVFEEQAYAIQTM